MTTFLNALLPLVALLTIAGLTTPLWGATVHNFWMGQNDDE